MADNLTVGSPGAGEVTSGEAPKDKRVDDGRAELDRLRQIAKERTGHSLDDRTLLAIVERHKTKIAQENKLKDSQQAFEGGRAKEVLTSTATDAQTLAAKATGTQVTKTPDGLSERDRSAVRADPDAGPVLPPASAKPASPEQAKKLVSGLLESFTQSEGVPLDLQAYAQTLKPRPPTQPKAEALARPQKPVLATERQPSARSEKPTLGGPAQPPATPLARESSGLTAGPRQLPPALAQSTRPAKLGLEGSTPQGGLGKPAAGTSLSFRPGAGLGLSTGTGVSPSGLFNAGGGLETHSSFDGLHFNWDGFFACFLIKSQKDMQEWRKLMKELRKLEGQAALAAHDMQIALLQMRQRSARQASVADFATALGRLPEKMREGEVRVLLSGSNPKRTEELKDELKKLVAEQRQAATKAQGFAAATASGQLYLSDNQIGLLPSEPKPNDPQTRYRNALAEYRDKAGPLAYATLVSDAAALTRDNGALQKSANPELEREAAAANAAFTNAVRVLMQDPRSAALINKERLRLRTLEQGILKEANARREQNPADSKLDELKQARASALRQLVLLDRAMADGEPRVKDRGPAYDIASQALAKEVAAAEQNKSRTPQEENSYQDLRRAASYQASLITGEAPKDSPGGVTSKALGYLNNPNNDENATRELSAAVRAGDGLAGQRTSLFHSLAWEQGIERAGAALRDISTDQNLVSAVDSAVQGAIALARKNRGETESLMRETVSRAQGMVNQLIQLLGMSRSR